MASVMGFLRYLRIKLLVSYVRFMTRLLGPVQKPHPDAVILLESRDKGTSIKTHVYRPPLLKGSQSDGPRPVLINFYGSGLALPFHGADDAFCRQVATATGHVVLDVAYRLAPEHPFPAAVHDVEDAVKYVLGRPDEYLTSKISLSGFSSGATLALVAPTLFPRNTFRSLIAFYPATNLAVDPALRKAPVATAKPRPAFWTRIFRQGYIRDMDPRDPRISPAFADTANYPAEMLVFTGDLDTSALEAEELAERAKREGAGSGRNVVIRRMKGCGHAFDKMAKTPAAIQARYEAYDLVVDLLQGIAE